MDGINLCSRYSLVPNQLGFCGPPHSAQLLKDYILGKNTNVEPILKRFEGLYPYLDIISKKHNLTPFDQRVVEAYWLGNELSYGYNENDFKELISLLKQRGLPESFCEKLLSDAPKKMSLTHNFHVFFVGVGRTTGCLPQTLENMDKCMISSGTVESIGKNFLLVDKKNLQNGGQLVLSKPQEKKITYDPELVTPKEGDIISIHWENAIEVISLEQKLNLEKYTNDTISLI